MTAAAAPGPAAADRDSLNDCFQANVAGFDAVLHARRQHRFARPGIWQRHPHRHQGAAPIRLKGRLNVVVGRGIGEVHPLHVNEEPEGLQRHDFAGQIEPVSLAIAPFVLYLAAEPCLGASRQASFAPSILVTLQVGQPRLRPEMVQNTHPHSPLSRSPSYRTGHIRAGTRSSRTGNITRRRVPLGQGICREPPRRPNPAAPGTSGGSAVLPRGSCVDSDGNRYQYHGPRLLPVRRPGKTFKSRIQEASAARN